MTTSSHSLTFTFANKWLEILACLLSCDKKDYEWALQMCEASREVHLGAWTPGLSREDVKVRFLPLLEEAKMALSELATTDVEHKDCLKKMAENVEIRLRNLKVNYLGGKPSSLSLDETREEAHKIPKMFIKEEVILDTNQKKLIDLKKQTYAQMERMYHTLSISKVKSLSNKLHNAAKQLKVMYDIISRDPESIQSLRKKIISFLDAGRKDLQKMHDVLNKAGVFELIDTLAKKRKLLNKESVFQESIPVSEKDFIKNLGLDEDESSLVYSFCQSSLWGRKPSLSGILGNYIKELEKYVSDSSTGEQQQDESVVVWVASAFSVFGGISLVGWNIAGYVLTSGVVVSPDSAVQSCIGGTTFIIGGAAGVITKKKKNRSKRKG